MDGEQKKLIEAAKKFSAAGMMIEWSKCLEYLYKEVKGEAYPEIARFRRRLNADMKNPRFAEEADVLLKKSYILTARETFEDYIIAMEWNRSPSQQFYLPRRFGLAPVVKEFQRLADDELDLLAVSLPPGVGKSTAAHFFITWLAGRDPLHSILEGSHSGAFVRGVYDEILRMLDPHGDYLWHEIFPERKIVKTDAQDLQIAIDKATRFPTFEFTTTGSANAGRVRAQQLLYCDDLVESIQEALSKERLDTKYSAYTVDLKQRKQGSCKELHIATRWSVYDPIGRLEEQNKDNPRAMFLNVPALNENGESNFDYGGAIGFTTEFYEEMRASMDEISFNALYMGKPVEREGLLYEENSMRWFVTLPPRAPDVVWGVCDTASGRGDDTVMVIFAVYGNDHYLIDCVCSDALPEVTDVLLAECLLRNKVKMCRFESNAAGGRTADDVDKIVKANGWDCGITKQWTQTNKETKIIVNSAWIKSRCLFRDLKDMPKNSEYAKMMRKAMTYSHRGKNKHDDVPDALAQYADFVDGMAVAQLPSIVVFDRRNFGF